MIRYIRWYRWYYTSTWWYGDVAWPFICISSPLCVVHSGSSTSYLGLSLRLNSSTYSHFYASVVWCLLLLLPLVPLYLNSLTLSCKCRCGNTTLWYDIRRCGIMQVVCSRSNCIVYRLQWSTCFSADSFLRAHLVFTAFKTSKRSIKAPC